MSKQILIFLRSFSRFSGQSVALFILFHSSTALVFLRSFNRFSGQSVALLILFRSSTAFALRSDKALLCLSSLRFYHPLTAFEHALPVNRGQNLFFKQPSQTRWFLSINHPFGKTRKQFTAVTKLG